MKAFTANQWAAIVANARDYAGTRNRAGEGKGSGRPPAFIREGSREDILTRGLLVAGDALDAADVVTVDALRSGDYGSGLVAFITRAETDPVFDKSRKLATRLRNYVRVSLPGTIATACTPREGKTRDGLIGMTPDAARERVIARAAMVTFAESPAGVAVVRIA